METGYSLLTFESTHRPDPSVFLPEEESLIRPGLFNGRRVINQFVEENSWEFRFPRTYEIYLCSDSSHLLNFFNFLNTQDVTEQSPSYCQLAYWESILAQLDAKAWELFKREAGMKATPCPGQVIHRPLFDMFHEATGYVFLKEQGYEDIRFLPKILNKRSPDLVAEGRRGKILLEAKQIWNSDDENRSLAATFGPGMQFRAYNLSHQLPESLKGKIVNTIREAAEQLRSYSGSDIIERRIVYLSIWIDRDADTGEVRNELIEFLDEPRSDRIEVVSFFLF